MLNLSLGIVDFRTTRYSVARFLLFVLGIAAFLDFCATVLADFVPRKGEVDEVITAVVEKRHHRRGDRQQQVVVVKTDDPLIYDFLKFLDVRYVQINICFSLLWFICIFIRAQWKRDRKLRDLDRARLLNNETVLDVKTFERDAHALRGAWNAYYWTVGIQLLLLPVGFYVFIWTTFRRIVHPSSAIHDDDDDVEVDIVYTNLDGTSSITVKKHFSTHSTHCLLVALLHYCAVVIKQVTGVQLESSADIVKRKVIRRVLGFALHHPRKFVRRIRKAQTGIRWFKYLAPLIGTGNKLLSNVKDLMTKYRQYVQAMRAKRIRKQFWKLMSEDEKRQAAAIRIQKCYRAMVARRTVKALQLLQGTKESIAAIRVQSAFRACLARARTNLLLKEQELKRLEEQADSAGGGRNAVAQMSVDDRRRMYELQDELNATAKKLVNEKMLLRPNTSFAVTWKVLFVLCVIFEITTLVLKPRLEKYTDKDTGKPLDIAMILEHKVVPTPMTEWEECAAWLVDEEQLERKETKKGGLFQKFRRHRGARHVQKMERPWYCQEPWVTTQSIYISILRFMLSQTVVIVAIVCYCDVFVTFFTGTFDSDTGILEPKPFFTRWVIPGLTLQLLVNPRMETTSQYVFQLLSDAWTVGPIRVYRWSKALFYPLVMTTIGAVERWIWTPLVSRENHRILKG